MITENQTPQAEASLSESQLSETPKRFNDLELDDRLIKGLNGLNFEEPTEVQAKTIPLVKSGIDLLVSAETGSGKTAAFMLPILNRLHTLEAPRSATRALVLVPTRELARQVLQQCEVLGKFTFIEAGMIVGGEDYKTQIKLLRKNPEILIATPGRLLEHMSRKDVDLSDLEVLVLDEADRMLDMGFSEDVLKIEEACKKERQTLLFSATLKQKGMLHVIKQVLKEDHENLLLSTAQDQHGSIRQQIMLADDPAHKIRVVTWLLKNEKFQKAIIFTNTREQTNTLNQMLRKEQDLRVSALHGEMIQPDRNRVMMLLREGKVNILVATDVAARGLDIQGVDLVINLDMARNGDDYVHRIGRTGRAGQEGTAISLIGPNEWNLMSAIERYLKVRFERKNVKEVEGSYKGPKKVKASGKAAGKKKKKTDAPKKKSRPKNKKATGQRRAPSRGSSAGVDTGFEPPKRKKVPVTE
ncbi:DEAD/DEAH box helicase [Parendozoicomonas sp. Alg238-R29]|uniref:DEAD/DEAH box helicase n=1 Tax=Parendozoicomonas sp. Alg238-R29 TaxID=2993446 RepID=UPI00248EDEC6|nr:DEAD/DEAH box helicase [Parendozoicomonas sp. Alg238-R29]